MGRFHWRAVAIAAAATTTVATGVPGFASAASATGTARMANSRVSAQAGGQIIKFAEGPLESPNYIFPETPASNQTVYNNGMFINLMYQGLYSSDPYQPEQDFSRSIGQQPVWSDNDTVATVHLNHYVWSDGQPVTARDCVFYINLGIAEGPTWGDYAGPTQFPYDLKSYTAVNATTLRLVLKSPMNPTYYDLDGIGSIVPLPQQVWDKESANGPVGNYDMTPAGAKKVVAFLEKEASDTTTYTTNPLWKVVDGPWQLQTFGGTSSPDIFVPNPTYSGTHPKVAEFEELPFTSDSAEFTVLKSGGNSISVGYVPTEDIPAIPALKSEGFTVTPEPTWAFNYIIPDAKNPQVGPILSQPYMRQVLAHLVDQQTVIKHFMDGYGFPTYGPTPIYPKGNPYVSTADLQNPYPYSVSAAELLLKAHGWRVNPGGVDVCQTSGPAGCGTGVTAGEKLSLNLIYLSGFTIFTEEVDLLQSDAAQAGVQILPKPESADTVISEVTTTKNWELGDYGGQVLGDFPSGEGNFNTGGSLNSGGFSDPTLDKLIAESTTAPTLAVYKAYENLVVQLEPWIWQPVQDDMVATAKNLTGYGLTGEFTADAIEPNYWFFK